MKQDILAFVAATKNSTITRKALIPGLAALTIVLALGQTKPPPKKFEPPDATLYTSGDTLLIKDEGCAKDHVKALSMEGIQQRKAFADLLLYHCAEKLGAELWGPYRGLLVETKTFTAGDKQFVMARVRMVPFTKSDESGVPFLPIGPNAKEGWVLRSLLFSKQQIEAAAKQKKNER